MARTGSTRLGSTAPKAGAPAGSPKRNGSTEPVGATGRTGATRFRRRTKSPKPAGGGRMAQLRQAYRLTKESDPRIGWILLATFLFTVAVAYALLFLIPPDWVAVDVPLALMIGLLVTLIVFTRRATAAQYKQIEGKPGAALAALSVLKRNWHTDQAIAFTRSQDVVHRVVGPPGIVLVAEGNPTRLKQLLTQERIKHTRVAAEAPLHEIVVGRGEGQVPLPKLSRTVSKMKRQVKPAQITDIRARLKALDATRSSVPLPKGPVPTSMKGMRGNLRGR
ncbi:MAG: Transmembrane protein MT2276, clustered with lipoate gene [uncultured Nocardioidaceae bacterium]|uniref:Transmembrane protein MT2276, clustered with lipoate protein n=1 Tax=uncultured Nocardioidaceae bacterium TaxID=253824 RepID=A0A6J4L9U8_9ACTN|nr:MAG: Transmembrane protein MT2276, clustered with lipoate gene [uncultured Nocardioidaceae bacterium]